MKNLQERINIVFKDAFGRTPLKQRLKDISGENRELQRYLDLNNMKEELGDLLSSAIQLANENEWNIEDLIQNTLTKIERRKTQYKALGRKSKVALYGGSFNPLHNGHIAIAKLILNCGELVDEVWFMPGYQSRYGKNLIDPKHRLAMCKLAAKYDGRFKVFDYEIKNKFQGETYHYMKNLLDEDFAKNLYEFSFIISTEAALNLPKWSNAKLLMNLVDFIVVPRPGYDVPLKDAWFIKDHIYIEPDKQEDLFNISSTDIRNMIANKQFDKLQKYLIPEIIDYINQHNLY